MRPTSSSSDLRGGRSGRTASGCLSRILRRILCFSNLPLRSFDHFKVVERESPEPVGAGDATPGVVARLMGLDSIPRVEPVDESPSSLGSADRCKTSCSTQVRRRPSGTIPAYQELEDDRFFILSFEKRRESHIGKVKSSRNSRRIQQSKEGKSSKREKRRGERERESESLQGENKENEKPGNLNNSCKKSEKSTMKKGITFENEDSSENSSPNSVLEFVGFSVHQDSVSPAETSRLTNSKMRRPLSGELENCGDSKGKLSNDRLDQEDENIVKSRHKQPNYAGKLGEIGRFVAMEMMRTSWLHDEILRNKHCLLEIGRDIASNIFDNLLEELVTNLEQF